MRHLTEEQLALMAGGDLRGWERWRAVRHLEGCETCRMANSELIATRAAVRDAGGDLPAGLDWAGLEREMQANIRLGLAAADCVTPATAPEKIGWRAGVAMASLTIVVLTGWYLSAPRFVARPFASVSQGSAVVEATPAGVELKHGPQGFTLLNPRANRVTYSVDSQGARAQYVDMETGQVTITNVALD
jgi:hypothetical protein